MTDAPPAEAPTETPKATTEEPKAEEPKEEEPKAEAKAKEAKGKAENGKKSATTKPAAKSSSSSSRPSSSRSSSKSGPPMKLPKWCGFPPWHGKRNVRFEVHKDGKKGKDIFLMRRPYFVLGKLPGNEIQLDHPSISRKHAMILHHKVNGTLHLIDLKSAHGTYLREQKIKPGMSGMVTLAEGSSVRFGASTRTYVIKGTAQVENLTSSSSRGGSNIGPAGPPAGTRENREAALKRKRESEGGYEMVKTVRKALTPQARLMLRRKQQEREALARRENLRKLAGSNKTIITGLTAKVVPLASVQTTPEETASIPAPPSDTGMVDEEEAVVENEKEAGSEEQVEQTVDVNADMKELA